MINEISGITLKSIVFFGTSEFAAPVLAILARNGWSVDSVITQPDQPAGRRQKLQSPPVKLAAEKLGLKIIQPSKLTSNLKSKISNLKLFVVCAYGQLLPPELLRIPEYGAINLHPSLLPKYRGPSPIQTAILNGEKETGVSLILLDEEMDHGPILAQEKTALGPDETGPELSARLAQIGANLLIKALPDYLTGKIKPRPQDHTQATFTKILKREDGRIDWSRPAREIYNQWRALQPWPGVFTELRIPAPLRHNVGGYGASKNYELRIKLIKICPLLKKTDEIKKSLFSRFVQLDKNELGAVCGDGKILALDQLQPEGKKVMTAEEFINGYMRNGLGGSVPISFLQTRRQVRSAKKI